MSSTSYTLGGMIIGDINDVKWAVVRGFRINTDADDNMDDVN